MHIEDVLGDVPKAKRCQCREEKAAAKAARKAAGGGSWLERLIGR
jgi:GTP cyclohydrolase II